MSPDQQSLSVRVLDAVRRVPAEAWDGVVGARSPFLEHAFLHALEDSGCVGGDTGWVAQHVAVFRGEALVGLAPAYVKLHSMGEFVYDWGWAQAAQRAGVAYYPKLVVTTPFTPATGDRILVKDGVARRPVLTAIMAGLQEVARASGSQGMHVLFCTRAEVEELEALGGRERVQSQYHWRDDGYDSFDHFLDRFRSKRRKAIRRERRLVRETGLDLRWLEGDAITPAHLRAMFGFYRRQCSLYGGWQYLTEPAWEALHATWRHRMVLSMAFDGAEPVAGAFLVRKDASLYGRYWGCAAEVPNLHFELCFYQPIERAIAARVRLFEPGQGGEHKFERGFEPSLCHSVHWVAHEGLRRAIHDFLDREGPAVRRSVEEQLVLGPLRGKGSEEA